MEGFSSRGTYQRITSCVLSVPMKTLEAWNFWMFHLMTSISTDFGITVYAVLYSVEWKTQEFNGQCFPV